MDFPLIISIGQVKANDMIAFGVNSNEVSFKYTISFL